jgi:signal peptidase I
MKSRVFFKGVVMSLPLLVACTVGSTHVFTQPNSSMEPTLLTNEKFTADMDTLVTDTLGRGQVVILEEGGQLLLKRVIAVEGDTIEGRNLKIFLNGKLLSEPYVQHIGKRPLNLSTLEAFGPVTVPRGKLFVAGDNRDYSFDSRDPRFGLVSVTQVRGKPLKIAASSIPARVGTVIH